MKITNISCGQFAGIRDRSIDLEAGINILYGKNESGKSTLVNLLSRTLFQNARLDGRRDKEFIGHFFPSAKKDGIAGDYIDGTVTFEAEGGSYTLSKEWGKEPRCTLSTPDGKLRDQKKIAMVLKEVLGYEEGVYGDLLLSSQNGSSHALESLLDAANDKMPAKKELTEIVTRAFAEGDGISVDAIGQAIQKEIDRIAGKHWNPDRSEPERKAGRWSNGCGEILTAYYALEDAEAVIRTVSDLEKNADAATEGHKRASDAAHLAEAELEAFRGFANQLILRSERQKELTRLEEARKKFEAALADWPALGCDLEKAQLLEKEKESRTLLDQYGKAKAMAEKLAELEALLESTPCPDRAELAGVKTGLRKLDSLRNRLCGMNLAATVRMLGDASIQIRSVRTGALLDITDESCAITEAVDITIPGVMQMRLAPADVDVAGVEQAIAATAAEVHAVLEKYGVSSQEQLEALAECHAQRKNDADSQRMRLRGTLGSVSFEALEAAARKADAGARELDEIAADIRSLCGAAELSRYLAEKEVALRNYQNMYGSIDGLKAKAEETVQAIGRVRNTVMTDGQIPERYRTIGDPEAYLTELENTAKAARRDQQRAYGEKTAAVQKLETYKEGLNGDPVEKEENARRVFEEKKTLLNHWLHIRQVFLDRKEMLSANPMQELSDGFLRYLGILSGGRVTSAFPEMDKLNLCLYTDDRLVDYGKLSEGTKDTVSLAFRLAALDCLFPEGGGVIVFDDPFTDMDADRTARACELVQECAKRHQVIFLTCREEYLDMLTGSVIRVGE